MLGILTTALPTLKLIMLPNYKGNMQRGITMLLFGPNRKFCRISQFISKLDMIQIFKSPENKPVPVQKAYLWKALPCSLPSSFLFFLYKWLLTSFYKFNEGFVLFPPAALSPVLHLFIVCTNSDNLIVPKKQRFTRVK